jgi:hypothetical protein
MNPHDQVQIGICTTRPRYSRSKSLSVGLTFRDQVQAEDGLAPTRPEQPCREALPDWKLARESLSSYYMPVKNVVRPRVGSAPDICGRLHEWRNSRTDKQRSMENVGGSWEASGKKNLQIIGYRISPIAALHLPSPKFF